MILNSLHRTSRWLMLLLFCLSLFAPIWLVLNPQPVEASLTFTYLGQVGTGVKGDGSTRDAILNNDFDGPNGIAVDANNNLYIGDYWTVRKFSMGFGPFSATLEASYGTPRYDTPLSGNPNPGAINPMGMFLSGNGIYVANHYWGIGDPRSPNILKLDLNLATPTGFGGGVFSLPYDIAEFDGKLYITDYSARNIKVYDSSNYSSLPMLAIPGSPNVRDIAVDSVGNLYVADISNDRIMVLNRNSGATIRTWGTTGSGDGQFNHPAGLAIDSNDRVYVTDLNNHNVQVFNSDGTFLTKWGSFGTGNGQFQNPLAIALDSAGRIYVSDSSNHRVQVFSNPLFATLSNLTLSTGTLRPNVTPGTLNYHVGVANSVTSITLTPTVSIAGATVTVNGSAVTSGSASSAISLSQGTNSIPIVVTAQDGTTLTYSVTVTRQRIPPANGVAATLVLGQTNFTSGTSGATSTTLTGPGDIAIDPTSGKVFVSDRGNHRVLRFASLASLSSGAAAEVVLGQPNFTSASPGSATNQMIIPTGLTVADNGTLWVADMFNHRVLGFVNAATRSNGASADVVLSSTPDLAMFLPGNVVVGRDGTLWVADSGRNRVLRFNNVATKVTGSPADGGAGPDQLHR